MKALLASLLIGLGIIYFVLDRELYFYAKNNFEIYSPLPVDVTPDYWGYDFGNLGFVLVDNFDFSVVGNGTRYADSDIVVAEILKYGFDEKQVVVSIFDSIGVEHTLVLNNGDQSTINVSVDSGDDLADVSWIEIKNSDSYIKKLVLLRTLVLIAFAIVVILMIRLFIRRKAVG